MSFTRRDFLKTGAILTAGAALPPTVRASWSAAVAEWRIDGPEIKQLALRALEAARAAGASYADARITRIQRRTVYISRGGGGLAARIANHTTEEREALAFGVRALVGGRWGFVASSVWSPEEAVRLGREAAAQAKTTASAKTPPVELGTVAAIRDGHWVTPVEIDPFTVPREEILDLLSGPVFLSLHRWRGYSGNLTLMRREAAFASTESSYATQIHYRSGGAIGTRLQAMASTPPRPMRAYLGRGHISYTLFPMAGHGWEYFLRASVQDELERLIAEADEDDRLPVKPLEVGRYDVAFDATTAARLVDATLGRATELDRALGYETNARGTSYLNDPFAMLGTHEMGVPFLNLTANRSLPGGAATVKWDDEGVAAEDFTLIKDGVLVDFLTTRESAGWLRDAYAKQGKEPGSHGCADASSALGVPQIQPPNLRLAPGANRVGFEDFIAGLKDGIAVKYGAPDTDFNALNAMITGDPQGFRTVFYEVKGGKKVATLRPEGTAVLTRAPELWRSVLALGGPDSMRLTEARSDKGQPSQTSYHTVEAPPMLVKQLALVDPKR